MVLKNAVFHENISVTWNYNSGYQHFRIIENYCTEIKFCCGIWELVDGSSITYFYRDNPKRSNSYNHNVKQISCTRV